MAKVIKPFVGNDRMWKPGEEARFDDKTIARLIREGYVAGEVAEFPKHIGGGSYELSNGAKVKGKAEAAAAQAALDAEDAK